MPYKITLRKDEQTTEVIVKEVELLFDNIQILKQADPYIFPEDMQKYIRFNSKNLSAIIFSDSPVEIEKIEPTDEEPDEVEPTF